MSKTGGRQIARESPTARPWPISSDIRASRMRNLASGGGPSGFHPAKTCTPGTRGRGSGPYPYANRAVRRLAGRHQSGGQLQRFNMDEIVAAGVDKHRREIHFFGHCLEIGQFCTPVEQSSEEHRRNTVNNRNQPRIPELTLRIETIEGFFLGTSIPMVPFPGIGAIIRIPRAERFSAISSCNFFIAATRIPASGTIS